MDKILSARLDEAVIHELERVTRRLRITKKRFLEEAIRMRARQVSGDGQADIWSETLGAWKRKESPAVTVRAARRAFQESFERHHRGARARLR